MLIAFRCLNCGKGYQKDANLAGKKGRCSGCGHIFEIPGPPGRTPAAMAAGSGATRPSGGGAAPSGSPRPAPPRGEPVRPRAAAAPRTAAPGHVMGSLDEDPYGLDD